MSESNEVNFALRLPTALDKRIRELATEDRRSINAEIVRILESWDDMAALEYRIAQLRAAQR